MGCKQDKANNKVVFFIVIFGFLTKLMLNYFIVIFKIFFCIKK
jgi:hypothetical protein